MRNPLKQSPAHYSITEYSIFSQVPRISYEWRKTRILDEVDEFAGWRADDLEIWYDSEFMKFDQLDFIIFYPILQTFHSILA